MSHTAKPFSIKYPKKLQIVLESVYQINSLFPQMEDIATWWKPSLKDKFKEFL